MKDIHQLVSRQVNRWNVERAAFQEKEKVFTAVPVESPAKMKPLVCISRQRGCRGLELSKLLAHELNYGLFDKEIIDYIAKHIGVRSEVVESLDERDRSELELWIEGMLKIRIIDRDDYIHALGEVVKTASLQGGVVILGRGANYLLEEQQCYRVRIVAPEPFRIRTIMETEGMAEAQAVREIHTVDRDREHFVKRYFHKDINRPEDYDLVINLAAHTMNGVVKIILSALRARGWAMELTGGDKRYQRQAG